ncbi:PilZ domain-containing protein [Microvirga aerilata]|uniref:PilZ domain-containing protein n=1 Tax=Microvirga aerilata TaxID=670292 RepID=A0A936ZIH1_9HYPH|nr:PilZ domain-containing protein [Microvirga aerilata]
MNERRASKRWRTVLKAQIVADSELSPTEFIVRDLSDTGARIYFADADTLPPEFKIEIPSKGLQVRSRLVWSRGANHGVMFLEKVRVWTDPLRAAAA